MASRVSPHPPDPISRKQKAPAHFGAHARIPRMKPLVPANFGENDLVRVALSNDSSLLDWAPPVARRRRDGTSVSARAPGAALRFSISYHVLSKPGVRIRYISVPTTSVNKSSFK